MLVKIGLTREEEELEFYIKDRIKFVLRPDIQSNTENCEIIAIEIINEQAKNIIIISLYRCPGTDINEFIDTVNQICLNIKNENKHNVLGW